MSTAFPVKKLSDWFLSSKRDLPWRNTQDPYAIWVSEVMLQQTQVSVVIPYFERWMTLFPTIEALSLAPLDQVIKAWEGLGYYSRARNLHAGACQVMEEYGGVLPEGDLLKIKGIGEYTAGAIAAFAFRKKAAAVDGNVMRVMARFSAIEECITRPLTKKNVTKQVEELLPDQEPWVITEALIELGATHCAKRANCRMCPLRSSCKAYLQDRMDVLPIKTKKIKVETLYRTVVVLSDGLRYWASKGVSGKVMADLYEFPYWETDSSGLSCQDVVAMVEKEFGTTVVKAVFLSEVRHGFTRYRARLMPWLIKVEKAGQDWIPIETLETLPFSSGHRKILSQVQESFL